MNWYKKIASQIQGEKRLEQLYQKSLQMKKTPEESSWIIRVLKEIGYDDYFKWLLKVVNTDGADIHNEGDTLNIIESLQEYHQLKTKKKLDPGDMDLNRFKNVSDLYEIVSKKDDIIKSDLEDKLEGADPNGYNIVYNQGGVSVIRVDSWSAAEPLFKDSKWCVRHRKTYDTYTPPYYLFLVNGVNFALFNPESKQLLNRNDAVLKIDQIYQIKDSISSLIENNIINKDSLPKHISENLLQINEMEKASLKGDNSLCKKSFKGELSIGNYGILNSDLYKKYGDLSDEEIRESLKVYFKGQLSVFGNSYEILDSDIYKKYPVLSDEEIRESLKVYFKEILSYGNYNILLSGLYKKYPVFSDEEIREGLRKYFKNKLSWGNDYILDSDLYKRYPVLSDEEIIKELRKYFKSKLSGSGGIKILDSDLYKKYPVLSDEEIRESLKVYFMIELSRGNYDILLSDLYKKYPVFSDEEIKRYINSSINIYNGPKSFFDRYPFLLEMSPEYNSMMQQNQQQVHFAKSCNWYKKIAQLTDEAKSLLQSSFSKVVESYSKYGYDIFLIHNEVLDVYQISIQGKGRDFSSREQQFEKKRLKFLPQLKGVYDLIKLIKIWKEKYSPIYIGTPNISRAQKYYRILSAFGFNLTTDTFCEMVKSSTNEIIYRIN